MPKFTVEQLREQLRQQKLAPVYVLCGAETYLRDIAARTIADRTFGEGDFRDFNDSDFSLADSDNIKNAIAAAEQLPMMSRKRVVRVTDVRVGVTSARDTLKEEHERALAKYLERPADTTVLIFIADELNGNRRIAKLLTKFALHVEFFPLTDIELARCARAAVRDAGSEIDERTVSLLVSLVGADVRRLTNEIQKLSTAVLPDKLITADLVESLVAHSRELTNFELTDHLMAGRKPQVLAALKKILDDGTEPLALLGLIASNYRRLLTANSLMAEGADRSEVAGAARMHPQQMERFLAAARRGDARTLSRAVERLAATDLAIKTSVAGGGSQGSRMQLEMLVCELASAS